MISTLPSEVETDFVSHEESLRCRPSGSLKSGTRTIVRARLTKTGVVVKNELHLPIDLALILSQATFDGHSSKVVPGR